MKIIWIVNYYASTPKETSNPRYLEFAKCFMKAGCQVLTFNASSCSGISNEEFGNQSYVERKYGDFHFVHIKVPEFYGNGVKRMYSLWQFAHTVSKLKKQFAKPDVVLQNIHPPFDYSIARMAKSLKAKYIVEAWDLWPDDFVTFGLVKANNPALKVAYQIEKQYYYHADEIVFTFEGALNYLKNKGWTKETGGKIDLNHVHYINNGVNLNQFDADKVRFVRHDEDLDRNDIYKIVYLGAINRANNVKLLIETANLLKNNEKYRFFIYGDGAYRAEIEQYVKEMKIWNVCFKEKRIPLSECAWVVSQATVNVMNYEKGFGKWGVSSGKLFQYLAAGKPIVCNVNIAYDDVITNNNIGVARDFSSSQEFADAIRSLAEQTKADYDSMCKRVRDVAQRFDYRLLSEKELELVK